MNNCSFSSAATHLRSPGKIFFCLHARSGQALRTLPFACVPGCLPAQSEQPLQLGSCEFGEILAVRSLLVGSSCAASRTRRTDFADGVHMLGAAGAASAREARFLPDVLGSLPTLHPAACKQLSF